MTEIPAGDIKIEVWPYSKSPGGQQCGTHPGIRVTHIPSNTVATVDCAGSQHRNKEIAMDMILAAITHPRFRP